MVIAGAAGAAVLAFAFGDGVLEDPRSYDDTRLDRQERERAATASEDGRGDTPRPDASRRTR